MLRLVLVGCFAAVVLAQEEKIPCGLPPFVDKLPQKQSSELKKVWESYTAGSCEEQQQKTFEIVGSLTPEERVSVFGPPPPAVPVAPLVRDAFHAVPMFIRMMTPEQKKQFDEIWMNSTLEDDVKHRDIEEFGKKNFTKKEQLDDFTRWLQEIKTHKAAIDDRISKLSSSAKKILKKLIKVRAEEQQILAEVTPELGVELHGLI